ncbi:MAG: twin-arginine translocation pathway signal protein [Acidobacteria bacterium]|nr:twin-arginine translocation pathway signal protein [Acidobacteriota bacterium]
MWTRRTFLGAIGAGLTAQPASRPNVVLIMTDDMGYADLGCYGSKDISTPHIDGIARSGVRLTDCYSNGPVCTPTRCGLMTGRYQQRFGLEWALGPGVKGYGLEPHNTTIATLLKNAGYKTALFGKWHLGYEPEFGPNRHGFETFAGLLSGNVDHYSHKEINDEEDWYEDTKPVKVDGYSTELIRDRAVKFIDAQSEAAPFFLYLPFNAVHWPFQAPGRPGDVRTRPTWFDGTRKNDYKPMLEAVDGAVGAVLSALERKGFTRNTLVIFTNDNGGERLSDNRPFFHHKATLWEGGIRVAGIVKWPSVVPAGKTSKQAAMSMDFTATIAEACGVSTEGFDGASLLSVLKGEKPEFPRTFFWRINRAERVQRACRKGNWKWIAGGEFEQLHDLSKDVGERVNVSWKYPEVTRELSKLYSEWETMLKKNPPPRVIA